VIAIIAIFCQTHADEDRALRIIVTLIGEIVTPCQMLTLGQPFLIKARVAVLHFIAECKFLAKATAKDRISASSFPSICVGIFGQDCIRPMVSAQWTQIIFFLAWKGPGQLANRRQTQNIPSNNNKNRVPSSENRLCAMGVSHGGLAPLWAPYTISPSFGQYNIFTWLLARSKSLARRRLKRRRRFRPANECARALGPAWAFSRAVGAVRYNMG